MGTGARSLVVYAVLLTVGAACIRSGFESAPTMRGSDRVTAERPPLSDAGVPPEGGGPPDGGGPSDSGALTLVTTALADPQRREVPFEFTLADDGTRRFSVVVERAIEGGPWLPAMAALHSAPLDDLEASPAGSAHTFVWSSLRDLGPFDVRGVQLRVTARATDGATASVLSAPFDLFNSVTVAASLVAGCASHPEGTVECWGTDRDGVLGDGPASGSPGPVSVEGIHDARQVGVSAGFYNASACALLRSGFVSCWGTNDVGQLGDGTDENRDVPVAVVGVDDAVELTLGFEFACVRRTGGSVSCWGQGASGQLGDGQGQPSPIPVAVVGLTSASKVISSTYASHACALQGAELWCWGANGAGQLGDGTTDRALSPVRAQGLGEVRDVAVGQAHTCAALTDGTVWCFGDNDEEQLGPDVGSGSLTPSHIPGIDDAIAVVAGASNACAIRQDRTLWCWGDNTYNNLLDASLVDQSAPVALEELDTVAQVSMGGYTHAGPPTSLCAVRMSGEVVCWGYNLDGQQGGGRRSRESSPVATLALGAASGLALGAGHSCGLVSGAVLCYGGNVSGTLGDGTAIARVTPTPVPGIAGAIQISAGSSWHLHGTHVCALVGGGAVSCWGSNGAGQLGDGNQGGASPSPVAVVGIGDAVQLEIGENHSCVRLADGSVRCWGGNYNGALGDGTNESRTSPVEPLGLGPVSDVATFYRHVCAIVAGGEIRCWGECDYGEAGSGDTGNFNTPQPVQGISGALEVDAGGEHVCAVLADKSVACWGADYAGQLGNGALGTSYVPSPVDGLTDVRALALGSTHSCALREEGTVWCWGDNSDGELGDGTTRRATSPVQVVGVDDARAIFAGNDTTCVIAGDGLSYCFGDNQFGQLGTGEGFLELNTVGGFP